MKGIYNDINEIFKIPFRKIFIDLKIVGMGYKVVFNWINSISSDIPVIQVAGDCSFEAYSWVFDNLRPTKEVQFLAKPVEFLAKEAHPIKQDIIFIKYGEWVKVEHLKVMESSSIYIGNSSITDEQINEFLHALVSGSNPNLKKLVIGITRDPDADLLLDSLDASLNDEHIWCIQLGNGRECIVQNVTYEDEEQEGIEIDIGRNEDVRER
ncbi:hypothetical protein CAEBREN_21087 [Caenorhabditis brenneri]|uniref:Sdz-33 F-box domain-containing protein n=1 Tax=Caenorhabditis brenneri TaxID=135651 RepID=G0N2G1_CAEBE|nr:hypothetical protein CAEBREN_21087 [Caenorhabditis brenneri]